MAKKPSSKKKLPYAEKAAFAADLTHDLLTAIAGIKLTAELLQKKIPQQDEAKMLQNIIAASNQMSVAIDYILQIQKESEQALRYSTFSAHQLVMTILTLITPAATMKNLTLSFDIPEDILITSDESRCFRILFNLIQNAVKYTQKGEITIRCQPISEGLVWTIKDTGIGISQKQQKTLFNPYIQAFTVKPSATVTGIGLGLHLAALFTEQLGGELFVTSKRYQGTTFTLFLPQLI